MNLNDLNLLDVGDTIQLAGAVYTDGNGGFMILPLPGNEGDFEPGNLPQIQLMEMDLDEWNTFLRQTDLVEVEALVKGAGEGGKPGRAILRKTARQISQNVSWAVYRRDHYRCRYCGTNTEPLTVDHLVLWEEGGPSTPENLLSACKKCNNTRGNTPYHAWLNSRYYQKVSQNLPPAIQEANERIAPTLSSIPISPRKDTRKRR